MDGRALPHLAPVHRSGLTQSRALGNHRCLPPRAGSQHSSLAKRVHSDTSSCPHLLWLWELCTPFLSLNAFALMTLKGTVYSDLILWFRPKTVCIHKHSSVSKDFLSFSSHRGRKRSSPQCAHGTRANENKGIHDLRKRDASQDCAGSCMSN